jgi:hypothetical protein
MKSRSAGAAERAVANVNLHIERLIVDGALIGSGRPAAVQSAVEVELTRLLTAGGLSRELAAGGTLPALSAGEIQFASGHPDTLGTQIARALYSSIAVSAGAVDPETPSAPRDAAPATSVPRQPSGSPRP